MELIIKETSEKQKAFEIASSLTNSFDERGLTSIRKDLENQKLFGAFLGDRMVGFILYKQLNPEAVELAWMGILKEHRGKGIGTKMVLKSLRLLDKNYKICEVKTLAENHPDPGYLKTREFYKKLGFISIEIISPYPGWSEDSPCQIFVKCLST